MARKLMLVLLAAAAVGCDKSGTTDVEMRVNNGFLTPAQPIEVAPDIPVGKNDFIAWDGGFRGRQRLEISGNVTLILVPGPPAHRVIVPDTFMYVGRRPGTTTAIGINLRSWRYRRIDMDNVPAKLDDDALRERLHKAPWICMGHYRYVALRSLLWAWTSTGVQHPYRCSANDTTDRLILHPRGVFGTIGDAASPAPPPEWNALIHALRELCPPQSTTARAVSPAMPR